MKKFILLFLLIILCPAVKTNAAINIDIKTLSNDDYLRQKTKYDPRLYGRVTKIKEQTRDGMCWTYAACACAESNLIYKYGVKNDIDLSELYYAYCIYTINDRRIVRNDKLVSFKEFCDSGGNAFFYNDGIYLDKFALEKEFPEVNSLKNYTLSEKQLDAYLFRASKVDIGYNYYNKLDTIDRIKTLLKENGNVYCNIYQNYNYYTFPPNKKTDAALFCPVKNNINHAVEIIGWDDDYSASNFVNTPEGNGAWLVKNSAGTGGWAGSGYIWISYYDKSLNNFQSLSVTYRDSLPISDIKVTAKDNYNYNLNECVTCDKWLDCKDLVWKNNGEINFENPDTYYFKGYDKNYNLMANIELYITEYSDGSLFVYNKNIHYETTKEYNYQTLIKQRLKQVNSCKITKLKVDNGKIKISIKDKSTNIHQIQIAKNKKFHNKTSYISKKSRFVIRKLNPGKYYIRIKRVTDNKWSKCYKAVIN